MRTYGLEQEKLKLKLKSHHKIQEEGCCMIKQEDGAGSMNKNLTESS